MKVICGNCGSIDTKKVIKEGNDKAASFVMILLLSLFLCAIALPFGIGFFFLGLAFIIFGKSRKIYDKCTSCEAENSFIGAETPKGKSLLKKYHGE